MNETMLTWAATQRSPYSAPCMELLDLSLGSPLMDDLQSVAGNSDPESGGTDIFGTSGNPVEPGVEDE